MALVYDPNLSTAATYAAAGTVPPLAIDREWCLGDSLFFINRNTDITDSRLTTLNNLIDSLSSALINQLITNSTLLSTQLNVQNTALSATIQEAVPAGAVQAFVQSTPPPGWVHCEGIIVPNGTGTIATTFGNITTNFAPLFAAVGTKFGSAGQIPDLRGYFIRGHGTNTDGTQSTGDLGRKQADAFKTHNHTIRGGSVPLGGGVARLKDEVHAGNNGFQTNSNSDGGGSETRPKNISLLYCIKY
jgi:hypothetical protein